MKKILLICIVTFAFNYASAQETKKDTESVKTKMEMFSSKTGTITKFTDTRLSDFSTLYGNAETRVRKVTSGVISAYFYQISLKGKYNTSTASIEYSDLTEVLKALTALRLEVEKDIVANPNYLENKFVTVDGLQVGYYVADGKSNWYIKLEKYGSDNTLYINNGDSIVSSFTEARNKIEELKKQL